MNFPLVHSVIFQILKPTVKSVKRALPKTNNVNLSQGTEEIFGTN